MTLRDEIIVKCLPELIASQEHGAIAALVSVGRTKTVPTLGGIGLVLNTLGPVNGAALLDMLETQSANVPALRWAFVLINRGELDFGSPATQAMIDSLLPVDTATALKAVAVQPDPVSVQQVIEALGA